MSWRERDYHQDGGRFGASIGGVPLPPRATIALLILHVVGFALAFILSVDPGGPPPWAQPLVGPQSSPVGILLHPFASPSPWSLLLVVIVLWSLAAQFERVFGAGRLVLLYGLANVLAGSAYWAAARLGVPARAPLDYPIGALVALCVGLWGTWAFEVADLFGKQVSTRKLVAGSGILLGLIVLARYQHGAASWLLGIGAAAGAPHLLAQLRTTSIRQRVPVRVRRETVPARQVPVRAAGETARGAEPARPTEPDIDPILAKISREGIQALTPAEREQLERARQIRLARSR